MTAIHGPGAFAVRGIYLGDPVEVTWVDGAITGPEAVLEAVRRTVDRGETLTATPTGPFLTPTLDDPLAALLTIGQTIDVVEVVGDRPTVESIPGRIY